MSTYRSASGSSAEDLFIELFSDTFGAEKAGYLYSQYPFSDIYQNSRFADFLIENGGRKVAIEIDDEASHNPKLVSQNKFYDDLLKQNSMIYLGWDVYRWAVRQMQQQPETVKDELRVFLGQHPSFKEIEDYLPTQRGKSLDGSNPELKEHQKQAGGGRRNDLPDGVRSPGGCADGNHRAVCSGGTFGARSGGAHE